MADRHEEAERTAATNSTIVMICTLLSRLLGVVKAHAIAMVFGATGAADVINFTFNIPNNFRKLFAEGALSSAYIPVFTTYINARQGKIDVSSALLKRMQAFQLLISLFLVVCTWVFRVQLIAFLSDFSDPAHIALSQELLVYFMVFLGAISFAALYGGVLQSHGYFFTAAAAPLLFSLSIIFFVIYTSEAFGPFSMAIGAIVGGTLQALVTFLRLRRLGYRWHFSFDFSFEPFRQVLHAWGPITISAVIAIVAQQFGFYFASTLEEGTVTAFSNAIIIWQAPYGIFFTAIATVLYPALIAAYANGTTHQLGELLERGLSYLATFLVPAALTLLVLSKETTAVLLQSGLFTLKDTEATARILVWFVIGMPIVAWYGFLQRFCFSTSRFTSTVLASLVVAVIDVLCMWRGIEAWGWGPEALSIANCIAYSAGVVFLWIVSVVPFHEFSLTLFARHLAKILLSNIPLCIACVLYRHYGPHLWWQEGTTAANVLMLIGIYGVAVLIVIVSYHIARIEFLSVLRQKGR